MGGQLGTHRDLPPPVVEPNTARLLSYPSGYPSGPRTWHAATSALTAWWLCGWLRPATAPTILDPKLTRIGVAAVYARGQWTVATDFTRS
ncbi:MAG: hypothetical protein ACYDC9_03890 [Dermatophilaceae bacterium]